MNPVALTGPAVEPVTLPEMRHYLRLDGPDDDDLVAALISSARLTVEAATRLALVSQTWRLTVTGPVTRPIVLPLSPLLSVDAVRVLAGGTATLLSPGQYNVAAFGDPARITIPTDLLGPGSVQVDATYGFGPAAADVPATLRLGVRQLVASWFENRGDGPSLSPAALPSGVRAVIAPFGRPRLA